MWSNYFTTTSMLQANNNVDISKLIRHISEKHFVSEFAYVVVMFEIAGADRIYEMSHDFEDLGTLLIVKLKSK